MTLFNTTHWYSVCWDLHAPFSETLPNQLPSVLYISVSHPQIRLNNSEKILHWLGGALGKSLVFISTLFFFIPHSLVLIAYLKNQNSSGCDWHSCHRWGELLCSRSWVTQTPTHSQHPAGENLFLHKIGLDVKVLQINLPHTSGDGITYEQSTWLSITTIVSLWSNLFLRLQLII